MATVAQLPISDQDEGAAVRRCRHCQKDITDRPPTARFCGDDHRYLFWTAKRAKPRATAVRSLPIADPIRHFCKCEPPPIIDAEPDFVRCSKCGLSPRRRR